jgi:uncharacterized protein YcbK (DUF882 family)
MRSSKIYLPTELQGDAVRRLFVCFMISYSILAGASLRGSRSSLKGQNKEADRENLTRIETDAQLERFKRSGLLVRLPETEQVQVDPRLPVKWRWCRPVVAKFLRDLGREYFAEFHKPLQVNSAVRTAERQRELRKRNGNATKADGENRSSHLTGATIDLARRNMTITEEKWLGKKLLSLEKQKLIEATKERKQACFHLMVFSRYTSPTMAVTPVAPPKRRR